MGAADFSRPAGGKPFVLVADDDRDTRELYRACFDTSGYRTGEAETGSQAIAAAMSIVPDVLLTDYVLPDVDGLALARRLKADIRTAPIRILMITGYATPFLERHAIAAGVERVFLKPCLPQAVLREVARTLSRKPPSIFQSMVAGSTAREGRDNAARAEVDDRVRQEFAALPGLTLTGEQARLVFDMDRHTVERILDGLVGEGFLIRTPQGAFRRPR
jgi:two-component system cell cycle response regulator DivK